MELPLYRQDVKMLFYICETRAMPGYDAPNNKKDERKYAQELCSKVESFNQSNQNCYYGFIINATDEKTQICFAAHGGAIPAETVREFLSLLIDSEAPYSLKEITMKNFIGHAEKASRSGYVEDSSALFSELDIDDFEHSHGRSSFTERVVSKPMSKARLVKRANEILCGETLIPEIERIFAGGATAAKGHPVHYMVQSNDKAVTAEVVELLMNALVHNNRLASKRYVSYKFVSDDYVDSEYRSLCKSTFGGAIAVTCDVRDTGDSEFANRGSDIITDVAELVRKHRNSLLAILCLPGSCERMSELFMENAGAVSFVVIKEQAVSGDDAKSYLRCLARKADVKPNRELYKAVETGKGYLSNDLQTVFEKWFDSHLKTHVYKQYLSLETAESQFAKKKPQGNAFAELDDMIGLLSAKEVIKQALDFYKAQKLFKDIGIDRDRPAMHMVFTGNPGTAKTTAARLFARIMKENNLLSNGDLYEVGRADLVDKYLGGTAPRVKKQFSKAKGSVLFIDEAYSLVDDKDGLYGDEAISTIVQEMENARDEMVVIFAGYPDKMERFLDKNPGLRSRIAFHVRFDDYKTEELCDILELMVRKHKMSLCDNVMEKVMPILDAAVKSRDFGNGRLVRNLFEKAKLRQASRLVRMDVGRVTKSDVATLISDDFEAPQEQKQEVRRIGY